MLAPLLLIAATALAHGPPVGTAVVRAQGTSATLTLTLDPRTLDLDADGDGRVDGAELAEAREALLARLDAAATLHDQDDRPGTAGLRDAILGGAGLDPLVDGQPPLRLVRQWSWAEAPDHVVLAWHGLGLDAPLALTLARVRSGPHGLARRTALEDLAEATLPAGPARVSLGLRGHRARVVVAEVAPPSPATPGLALAALAVAFTLAAAAAPRRRSGPRVVLAAREAAPRETSPASPGHSPSAPESSCARSP